MTYLGLDVGRAKPTSGNKMISHIALAYSVYLLATIVHTIQPVFKVLIIMGIGRTCNDILLRHMLCPVTQILDAGGLQAMFAECGRISSNSAQWIYWLYTRAMQYFRHGCYVAASIQAEILVVFTVGQIRLADYAGDADAGRATYHFAIARRHAR